jgi:hypothetical protein
MEIEIFCFEGCTAVSEKVWSLEHGVKASDPTDGVLRWRNV